MSFESHWAWQAADKLHAWMAANPGRIATLETGYGPSGAPHMGTVAEVLRTAMVAHAYQSKNGRPIRFLSITDDMDGLRRAPANEAERDMLSRHIGTPLCDIPDPDGMHASYAARNAALLRGHLRNFGMNPTEPSEGLTQLVTNAATESNQVICLMSSDLYRGGHYDHLLRLIAERLQDLMDIVLPELGPDRRATWCPFVPIHNGKAVTEARNWKLNPNEMTMEWADGEGRPQMAPLLSGGSKLQWRVDWAMRWVALDVDFEMHGKDLADSVRVGRKIANVLGGRAPVTLQYELFLDENGAKQSKSVGNGVSLECWERHAPPAAFRHFLARDPRRARKITLNTIPEAVDAWLSEMVGAMAGTAATPELILSDQSGQNETTNTRLTFATILAVTALADADDVEIVWRLLEGYDPTGVRRDDATLSQLIECAVNRHHDIGRPARTYITPDEEQSAALMDLAATLRNLPANAATEEIQYEVYEAGKRHGGTEGLRNFFKLVYGVMLGQDNGPRLGTLASAIGTNFLAERLESACATCTPTC